MRVYLVKKYYFQLCNCLINTFIYIDTLFFENIDVLFRVILSLLTYHKDNLLACDGMEQIMNFIKNDFPIVNKEIIDKIIKQVCTRSNSVNIF